MAIVKNLWGKPKNKNVVRFAVSEGHIATPLDSYIFQLNLVNEKINVIKYKATHKLRKGLIKRIFCLIQVQLQEQDSRVYEGLQQTLSGEDRLAGRRAQPALRAESRKFEKHFLACEAAGFGFHAFAIDVFGVMGPKSKLLFNRVIEKMIRETCCAKYKAKAICQRRISMAVQLGVSRQLLASREVRDHAEDLCLL